MGSLSQAIVQADECRALRSLVTPHECRRQLQCVSGAKWTPWAARAAISLRENGRPALTISALPGSLAYAFWYASSGHSRRTYP